MQESSQFSLCRFVYPQLDNKNILISHQLQKIIKYWMVLVQYTKNKKNIKKIITKHVSNSTYHGVKNAVKIDCKNYRVKLIKRGYDDGWLVCIFFLLCSTTASLKWLKVQKFQRSLLVLLLIKFYSEIIVRNLSQWRHKVI